jgi:uncharacterized SAM-binding protein YcdF (DUF218 family)
VNDFVLSKLLWALTQPATALFFLVFLGWLCQRWLPRFSQLLLGSAMLFLLVLSTTPIGRASLAPLEDRFQRPQIVGPIAGIVVLGGAQSPDASAIVGRPQLNDAAERMIEFVALARAHPDAKLLFTGGSGMVLRQDVREADDVPPLLTQLGFDPARVMLERNSRNTWENAVESKKLVQPKDGETWVLVTSAFHMPRAVGCFRRAGWNVLPYPVDYRTQPRDGWPLLDTLDQLNLFSVAAKEWVGLLSYHLMQRTDAWLPAPTAGGEG